MLRDQHEINQFFMRIQSLASEMDPELAQIDKILDDEAIFQGIKADLPRRCPQTTRTGRPSTSVEVILRMLVLKRLYGWSYEETEHHVRDSLVLRRFCRTYFESVPDDTVLLRWVGLVAPRTLEALNARVTAIAQQLRVTRGRKLRCDGTVVETNIHYPTDSSLLNDGVRVLSRMLKRARGVLTNTADWARRCCASARAAPSAWHSRSVGKPDVATRGRWRHHQSLPYPGGQCRRQPPVASKPRPACPAIRPSAVLG